MSVEVKHEFINHCLCHSLHSVYHSGHHTIAWKRVQRRSTRLLSEMEHFNYEEDKDSRQVVVFGTENLGGTKA